MEQHVCNDVIKLIPEKKQLHTMWEDGDLDGNYDATEYYHWINQYAPDMFVLIDTGDYIVPDCVTLHSHGYCEMYDATYSLYLVPASVWNDCSEMVLAADREWREARNKCQM